MKIGVQLSTVRNLTQTNKDFATTIKRLASMGFDAVHISGIDPEKIPPAEVAETCQAYDLEISCMQVDAMRIVKETDLVIEEQKLTNAKYIEMRTMPDKYPRTKDGVRSFMTDFIPAAREIKEAGLQLVYRHHSFEFERFDKKTVLERIADKFVDTGIVLDTFWVQFSGGDPAYWINKLASKIDILNLKDIGIVEGRPQMFEVLEGNLNWPAIFQAAREANIEYAMVEQDDCYGKDPFDCLRVSLQNIKDNGYFGI